MAKIYKAEIYIVDHNHTYNDLEEIITNINNRGIDISIEPFNVEKVEFQWYDEIDINFQDCPLENYRKYFKKERK